MSTLNVNTINPVQANEPLNFQTGGTTFVQLTTAGQLSGGGGTLTVTGTVSAGIVSATNTAKAWVNFCGSLTVRLSGSYNVSGVTDNGTGDYTVAFTIPMPNNGYCVSGTTDTTNTGGNRGTNGIMYPWDEKLTGSVGIHCAYGSDHNASQGAMHDPGDISVIIIGN